MTAREPQNAFLGQPAYAGAKANAGYWLASRMEAAERPIRVHREFCAGSLLAQSFNALWCLALNRWHRGEDVRYFAMLHNDVEPERWWLDKLIDELESRNLDVLSAVVPIKDGKGLTSTALHKPGDNWSPLCRLTMKEIYKLPETFTSEDVGHPLLLNTGCWVCRFGLDWNKLVHFTINDRIVFDKQRDMFRAQTEPEDWFFSRLLNDLGLRIGATRKIALDHEGGTNYTNTQPWGREDFDATYVSESQIPTSNPTGFRFPYDVDGWLLPIEGAALATLAAGKRVLEIGSYCGKSTICLAQTAKHVTAVDPHDGRGTPRPKDTFREMLSNLDRYGVRDKVTSIAPGATLPLPQYDAAFIDGAHDLESVRADIEICRRFLKPHGLIAFHDYRREPGQHDGRWDPGVTEAVNEFLSAGAELISTHATLAVVRPPALTLSEV